MKTKKLKIFLIMVTILACVSTICFATEELTSEELETLMATTSNEDVTGDAITSNGGSETALEEHDGDIFASGNEVVIDKAVNGNVFAMGNKVSVTGQVNGDMYVLASTSFSIDYGAAVYGNVFVLAPDITLNGVVYSLYTITNNFTCEYNGMAALDLKVMAQKISFAGYVERHIYFAASEALTLTDDAFILGNFNYSADENKVSISESATIKGTTNASDYSSVVPLVSPAQTISNYTTSALTALIFLLVVLLAIVVVKPNIIQNVAKYLEENPLKTLGFGALALLISTVVFMLLAAVALLLPALRLLFFVYAALYFILLVLSIVISVIAISKFIDDKVEKTKSETSILAYVLIVAIVLWLLSLIPFLGILVVLVTCAFGLGTMTIAILPTKKDSKKKVSAKKENKAASKEDEKPAKKEKVEDKKEDKKDEE